MFFRKSKSSRSPIEDVRNENNDGVDEDSLDDESLDLLKNMPKQIKKKVYGLLEKYESSQIAQISEHPDGGYEVRVFALDGLYYYYYINEDSEIVHLATMSKSKGGTMKKAFDNVAYDAERHDHPIRPEVSDYETGEGYNLTEEMRIAINKKCCEIRGHVYAVVNNNDGRYKVVFEVYKDGPSLSFDNEVKVSYLVDKYGNFTKTDNEVQIMKSCKFEDFNFTKTIHDFKKSDDQKIGVISFEEKKKEIPVDESFYKSQSIPSLLEGYKKETLVAQMNCITNGPNKKVDW